MLPRYLPHFGWRSWRDWLFTRHENSGDAWPSFLESLGGSNLPAFRREFDTLRTGLVHYFSSVFRQRGGGSILVSAQICRAVPLAIERAGLSVRYVDVGAACPTPEPAEYAAALDKGTLGVLVAPFYGHIQPDWSSLLAALNGRLLVLDMAQGLGLGGRVAPLVRRADAIGYSFGLGKGLDTGGGLLLTRAELELPGLARSGRAALAGALLKTIALRALLSAGCYRLVISRLDAIDAADQSVPVTGASVPADVYRLWAARLPALLAEISRARSRARALAAMPRLVAALRDTTVCFDPEASHLRQIIRVGNASRRDILVSRLRAAGVDCAPAGEPLPAVPSAELRFPHAAAFRSDAVRLPFLGRLNAGQFDRFRETLEKTVVDSLH